MRNHVIARICELAAIDDRIVFINGDLGYNVLNTLEEKYPDRCINVGIAEQNMTAVAAGMALEGNIVFTYSIGNFPTLRCIEQIRNDVCYHDANVKVLSVGGGFAYGDLGMTHHATEDIAMMRALPNMKVYVPADSIEAIACVNDAYANDGPAFVRMARGGEHDLHSSPVQDVTKLIRMDSEDGRDINILTCGTVLSEGIKLKQMLSDAGYSVGIFSSPCIKPIDRDGICSVAQKSRLIITMEEHNIIGGLGGAVSEVIAGMDGARAKLYRIGLRDCYTSKVGNQDFLRDYYKISAERNLSEILKIVEK